MSETSIEQWAEDQIYSSEQVVVDTKNKIRDCKRRSRLTETMEEQERLEGVKGVRMSTASPETRNI